VQFENKNSSIIDTPLGIVIDSNDKQSLNALLPIDVTLKEEEQVSQ
jgi:hypothetical protein